MAFDTKELRISGIVNARRVNPQYVFNGEIPCVYHSLLYNIDGVYKYRIGEQEIEVTPNSVLYLKKGSCCFCETVRKGTAICIDFEFVREIDTKPVFIQCDDTRKIAVLVFEIESEFRQKNAVYKVISDFYKIFSIIEHETSFGYVVKSDKEKIKEAIEYIEANYENPKLSIAEVASHVNLTVPVFRNKFTVVCGISPLKYFALLRISAAKKFLDESELSIEQIAMNVGFFDRYYFSRLFKKKCGISPSEYRKK